MSCQFQVGALVTPVDNPYTVCMVVREDTDTGMVLVQFDDFLFDDAYLDRKFLCESLEHLPEIADNPTA